MQAVEAPPRPQVSGSPARSRQPSESSIAPPCSASPMPYSRLAARVAIPRRSPPSCSAAFRLTRLLCGGKSCPPPARTPTPGRADAGLHPPERPHAFPSSLLETLPSRTSPSSSAPDLLPRCALLLFEYSDRELGRCCRFDRGTPCRGRHSNELPPSRRHARWQDRSRKHRTESIHDSGRRL